MTDSRAEQIIQEWGRLETDASNTMNLYQSVADHFFLRENQITKLTTPGEDKSLPVLDPTGMLDLQDMAAGMSAVIFPAGQYFCKLSPTEPSLNDNYMAVSYLNRFTEVLHLELFKSECNFLLEFNEFLMSFIGFGTANIYSEWNKDEMMLNFKDWDISNFRFTVDGSGRPNGCIIKWQYTAEQAVGMWGDKVGENVYKAAQNVNERQNKFTFYFCCKKRNSRLAQYSDNTNYPYSKEVINATDKVIVETGGYESMPYHIARWLTSSQEIWGRGQGCFALSADKELQRQKKALLLNADLTNNPPRQTHYSFEGTPRVYPGANNVVQEMDTVRALDRAFQGQFPITKDTLQMQQEIIHRCFYVKVFAPLDNLPGDRRTTVEIIERVKAGYMRLILPTMRLYNECLTPLVERCVKLLLRNGKMPPPPPELRGFKVEHLGRLALALQEQQADALQRFSQFALTMEQAVPNFFRDSINVDRAARRMATTFGVNESDLNTPEERDIIRQERIQAEQAQMAMMAAETAGKTYKDASGAPEAGSPAEALMGVA